MCVDVTSEYMMTVRRVGRRPSVVQKSPSRVMFSQRMTLFRMRPRHRPSALRSANSGLPPLDAGYVEREQSQNSVHSLSCDASVW